MTTKAVAKSRLQLAAPNGLLLFGERRLGTVKVENCVFLCLCPRLSLSLLHEDRMRLSIKIKQACFSTFDFHYFCHWVEDYGSNDKQ